MIFPTKLNLIAILIAAYAAFIYVRKNLYTKLPHYFDADDLDPQFQSILEVFRYVFKCENYVKNEAKFDIAITVQNFIDGWEQGGAALTVYYRGQKVVDVWGGYADVQAARKWRRVR
ncbi:unnamed protein product [Gongylonema pulchrum]|uniref:DUF3301 domain-containing protein n=1 Tax=Gongylonema pulchrum TaxID=637853 RepID=A0A183E4D7_9BILA|nr:unnamed protein product [Gongylonema pulchrum]